MKKGESIKGPEVKTQKFKLLKLVRKLLLPYGHKGQRSRILCPVFLPIKNPINRLRLHQFLSAKTTEANKSLKTDAKEAY